jgi:hypothetical protein
VPFQTSLVFSHGESKSASVAKTERNLNQRQLTEVGQTSVAKPGLQLASV